MHEGQGHEQRSPSEPSYAMDPNPLWLTASNIDHFGIPSSFLGFFNLHVNLVRIAIRHGHKEIVNNLEPRIDGLLLR